jgi:hypothetical protein
MNNIKTMTVGKLLEQLENIPKDLPVYIWVDGDRYPIVDVDDSWVDEGGWLDINTIQIENYAG